MRRANAIAARLGICADARLHTAAMVKTTNKPHRRAVLRHLGNRPLSIGTFTATFERTSSELTGLL
jgi:hypothetical protein